MTAAVLFLSGSGAVIGLALWLTMRQLGKGDENIVVEQVNAILPQTQCGQCNYAGCRPYAEAIVHAEAPINQCPPGGAATIKDLAILLGREQLPLNPANGTEETIRLAYIHEDLCIGCKKCILVCPVDAIVGAPKKMHTVIASECTGCDLCVEPCPVDCIDMLPPATSIYTWRTPKPEMRS